jgi:hypothetical protein
MSSVYSIFHYLLRVPTQAEVERKWLRPPLFLSNR